MTGINFHAVYWIFQEIIVLSVISFLCYSLERQRADESRAIIDARVSSRGVVTALSILEIMCEAIVTVREDLSVFGPCDKFELLLNHVPKRGLEGTSFKDYWQESDRDRLLFCIAEMHRTHIRATMVHVRLAGEYARVFQLFITYCSQENSNTYYVIGVKEEDTEPASNGAHIPEDLADSAAAVAARIRGERHQSESNEQCSMAGVWTIDAYLKAASAGKKSDGESSSWGSSCSSDSVPISFVNSQEDCEVSALMNPADGRITNCSAGFTFIGGPSSEGACLLEWVVQGGDGLCFAMKEAAIILDRSLGVERSVSTLNVGELHLQPPHSLQNVVKATCTLSLPSLPHADLITNHPVVRIELTNLTQHRTRRSHRRKGQPRVEAFAGRRSCLPLVMESANEVKRTRAAITCEL